MDLNLKAQTYQNVFGGRAQRWTLQIAHICALTGMIVLGFTSYATTSAKQNAFPSASERRIHANLLQVRVDGMWRYIPMMPLAERLCRLEHPMYQRYCRPAVPTHPANSIK